MSLKPVVKYITDLISPNHHGYIVPKEGARVKPFFFCLILLYTFVSADSPKGVPRTAFSVVINKFREIHKIRG